MNALADREIIELLRERPDLLAVADAVSSTQEAPLARRRAVVRFAFVPAVAAAAAVILLVVAAPWQHTSENDTLFFERALAVIGADPVLHFVLRYSSHESVVNLATGEERPRVHRNEFWLDAKHHKQRVRLNTDGGPAVDYATHGRSGLGYDPALAGFATRYRDALEQGRARIVGDTEVDGRPAKRIEFTSPDARRSLEEVAVDAETFVPLTITYTAPDGRSATVVRVLRIESLPYDPALLRPRKSTVEPPVSLTYLDQLPSSVAEATRVLGRPPLGLGSAPDSVELDHVSAKSRTGAFVELTYGDVKVREARDELGILALGVLEGANPLPPAGSIALFDGRPTIGWLSKDGLVVHLTAPSYDDALAAARELAPLP